MHSTIKIEENVKKELRYLKVDDQETFSEVIQRLLNLSKDKVNEQYTGILPPIIDLKAYPFD